MVRLYILVVFLNWVTIWLSMKFWCLFSFSANICYRFCTAPTNLLTKQTVECSDFLHTKNNYENLVSQAITYLTDIKEPCIWNELSSIHVSENLSCDIMHDLFEGVCHYD